MKQVSTNQNGFSAIPKRFLLGCSLGPESNRKVDRLEVSFGQAIWVSFCGGTRFFRFKGETEGKLLPFSGLPFVEPFWGDSKGPNGWVVQR